MAKNKKAKQFKKAFLKQKKENYYKKDKKGFGRFVWLGFTF